MSIGGTGMKTKYAASTSLAVMAGGFILTTIFTSEQHNALSLLQGGFEAGLVGGIADWFAVTALFRHPLGLRIPHTNLIIRNKDKMVNALVSALENELLNKESISARLRRLNLIGGAGRFIVKQLAKRSNREAVIGAAMAVVERLPLERLSASVRSGLAGYARGVDLRPAVEGATSAIIRDGLDEKALDYALDQAVDWVAKPSTGKMLGEIAQKKLQELQVGGFMGFAVQAFAGFMNEEKMGAMLQHMLLSGIKDLGTPGSRQRDNLLLEFRSRVIGIAEDEEKLAAVKGWLEGKVDSEEAEAFFVARLSELKAFVLQWLQRDKEEGGRSLVRIAHAANERLKREEELVRNWEERLSAVLVSTIEANHYRLGLLVRENLNSLDNKALVELLESKVGGDLQWIRVNGAVCGFLVGILLTLLGWVV